MSSAPRVSNDADDEVEDDDEAEKERQRLEYRRLQRGEASWIHGDRADRRRNDESDRELEAAPTKPHAGVDEQRRHPAQHDQPDEDPVRLELERQLARDAVAADGDEEDHQQQRDQDPRPRQGGPTNPDRCEEQDPAERSNAFGPCCRSERQRGERRRGEGRRDDEIPARGPRRDLVHTLGRALARRRRTRIGLGERNRADVRPRAS